MDEKRTLINKKVYNEYVKSLGEDFLKNFPFDTNDIYPYITRRKKPFINPNLPGDLAKKMLDSRLSDIEYLQSIFSAIVFTFYGKTPLIQPRAFALLSQTGVGKTKLKEKLIRENPNTVIINPDLCKKFNPKADIIRAKDPTHFGALTGIDSYDNAHNLTEIAVKNGFNILIECAPSNKGGLLVIDIPYLEKNGYELEYHTMAVGNLLSLIAIHKRFELGQNQLLQNGSIDNDIKLTDFNRHNDSYSALIENIRKFENSKVKVYRRGTPEDNCNLEPVLLEGDSAIALLLKEQKQSNAEYIESGKYQEDIDYITSSMNKRRAPINQMEQFNKVKNVLREYILRNKEQIYY